jgi:hypothetical protein
VPSEGPNIFFDFNPSCLAVNSPSTQTITRKSYLQEHHNLHAAQSLCSSVARSCSDHLPICLRGSLSIGLTSTILGAHTHIQKKLMYAPQPSCFPVPAQQRDTLSLDLTFTFQRQKLKILSFHDIELSPTSPYHTFKSWPCPLLLPPGGELSYHPGLQELRRCLPQPGKEPA